MSEDFTHCQTTAGGLAVVAIMATLAFGLPWLDSVVSPWQRWPDGMAYEVGQEITVTPQPESDLDVGYTRPGRVSAQARFTVRTTGLTYTIRLAPFEGSLRQAADQTQRRLRRAVPGIRLDAVGEPTATAGGVPWRGGAFSVGHGRQGRYGVYLPAGRSRTLEVVVVGAAPAVVLAAEAIDGFC